MPIRFKPIIPKHTAPRKLLALHNQFVAIMGGFVAESHDDLATYPPQRAGVDYRRTGTLGRSWQSDVKTGGGKIVGTVASQGQIAPYNVYVQGPNQVRWAAAYGWKQPKDVMKKRWPRAVKQLQAAIKAITR